MKAVPEPPNGMIDYGPPESRPSTRTAHSPGESSFITAESPSTDRYYGVTDSSAEESGTERDVADHTLSDDSDRTEQPRRGLREMAHPLSGSDTDGQIVSIDQGPRHHHFPDARRQFSDSTAGSRRGARGYAVDSDSSATARPGSARHYQSDAATERGSARYQSDSATERGRPVHTSDAATERGKAIYTSDAGTERGGRRYESDSTVRGPRRYEEPLSDPLNSATDDYTDTGFSSAGGKRGRRARVTSRAREHDLDTFDEYDEDENYRDFLMDHTVPQYGPPNLFDKIYTEVRQHVSFLLTTIGFSMVLVIALGKYCADMANPLHHKRSHPKVDKEWMNRITGERYSDRLEYYAEFWGYECELHDVETEDGFVLRVHHLLSHRHRRRGHPVLIQHGILCNSVNFVVSEERSMAFWFLEQGYDVWLSNIRTNFKQPHKKFSRSDPRYWAWSFKEIGVYDCYAAVSYVYEVTGRKVSYIGHSQGAGTMFLVLSRGVRPELGRRMRCFVAMGPAVYAGPVLRTFPFNLMRLFTIRDFWQFIFGFREFIPFLNLAREFMPGWLFGYIAYCVFYFIFGFDDAKWVPRQIPKFFRTTPQSTSAELLFFYLAGWSHQGCLFDEDTDEHWFGRDFPPLQLVWGTLDTLCPGAPTVERIRNHEIVIRDRFRELRLEDYHHLDLIWHVNLIPDICVPIRDFIEDTRSGHMV